MLFPHKSAKPEKPRRHGTYQRCNVRGSCRSLCVSPASQHHTIIQLNLTIDLSGSISTKVMIIFKFVSTFRAFAKSHV